MSKWEEDGRKGEEVFANLCNKWKCEYLHIRQERDELSSEMFRNSEKRPDFLVNVPDVAPIFIEVKVRQQGRARLSGPKSKLPAFGEDREQFARIRNFERKVRMSTWYAFIEKSGDRIDETVAYLCPVARMERQIPLQVKDNPKWSIIWTPRKCMNRCDRTLDLTDMCIDCPDRICESSDF